MEVAKQAEAVTVDFAGQEIVLIDRDGEPYVAMKPIVDGIGMDWKSQYEKISENKERFSYGVIPTTGSDGKVYEMLCIPLKKLNGWLFTINANKVKPEIRATVRMYQEECFAALYDYWMHGMAVNPSTLNMTPDMIGQMLNEAMLRSEERAEKRERERQELIQQKLNEALRLVSPRRPFGEISETTGKPKTKLVRSYWSTPRGETETGVRYLQLTIPLQM